MKRVNLGLLLAFLAAFWSCKKAEKQEEKKELMVSTFAGAGGSGYKDDVGALAAFFRPRSLAVDASGNLFITDIGNARIRKITPDGVVTSFAGSGVPGYTDGTGTVAQFGNKDCFITVDAKDNLYVTDTGNSCVRKITPSGVVTTIAGKPDIGSTDGPVATAGFSFLNDGSGGNGGIAVDASNNIFVTDVKGIRKITPDGMVSTWVKSDPLINSEGPVATATIYPPKDIVIDAAGNIYALVMDAYNRYNILMKITVTGMVQKFAGNSMGYLNGIGQVAQFYNVQGLGIDRSGNIYAADTYNHVIRRITPDGVVSLFAGQQTIAVDGLVVKDGPALEAFFIDNEDVAVDSKGSVYVVERQRGTIRKISLISPLDLSKEALEKANWNKPKQWK